jgi:hypothetical protein
MDPKRKYGVFAQNMSNQTHYLLDEPVSPGGTQLMYESEDYEKAEEEAEFWERGLSVIWKVSVY